MLHKVVPILLFVLAATLPATSLGDVYTKGIKGCKLQDVVDKVSDGRFIWKPTAAHFEFNAVIVLPRYYTGVKADVEVYDDDEFKTKLDESFLKTNGDCEGSEECLFRQTFLVGRNGAYLQRKYKSIIVKIAPDEGGTGKECRIYKIKRPAKRAEFAG